MILKASLLLTLASCVLSNRHGTSEQKIERFYTGHRHHGDLSHIGDHEPEHHDVYAWAYPSYEFSYHVDDPHTHDQKAQHEVRDGDKVTGSYWLVQPDGYKRVVKYHSDHKNGFEADVKYIHNDHNHEVNQHYGELDHKLVKHHDGPKERRDQGREEKRGRDHRRNIQEHHEKQEHKEERLPQVHRHEIRDHLERHENKEERIPQIHRELIREHHEKRTHELIKNNRHEEHDKRLNRGHDEHDLRRGRDEDHSEKFWRGSYDSGKEREVHNDDRSAEHNKDESWGWKARRNEEHWKHGVLVGWTEGRGRDDRHDRDSDRRGRDDDHDYKPYRGHENHENNQGHEDRRDQRSYHTPKKIFKPLIPYGQRLH